MNETRSLNTRIATILSELHRKLEQLYGSRLLKLVLYGSQARGDAHPYSDIDVMVVLTGTVDPVLEIHRASEIVAAISLDYDVVLSCFFVSAEEAATRDDPFFENVNQDGILV